MTASSCEKREPYTGRYLAQEGTLPSQSEISIELKDQGMGVFRVGDDEAPFRWQVKNKEIRLHTKSGGVLIGTIQEDLLHMSLPGTKIKVFKRVTP
jgi:hypothetical protein